MYLCYDLEANALYVGLATERSVAETHTIDEGTMVDVNAQGTVVGIEIINPQEEWPLKQIKERFQLSDDQIKLLDMLLPPRITAQAVHRYTNIALFTDITEDRISAYCDFLWEPPQHRQKAKEIAAGR